MGTRSKGEILFLLEIGLGVLISFWLFIFLKSISLFNPLPPFNYWPIPVSISHLPLCLFSRSASFSILSNDTILCSASVCLSTPYPVSPSFCPYYICLNVAIHPEKRKMRVCGGFFSLSAVKSKETINVYFGYDIFLMLLSDRNLEK